MAVSTDAVDDDWANKVLHWIESTPGMSQARLAKMIKEKFGVRATEPALSQLLKPAPRLRRSKLAYPISQITGIPLPVFGQSPRRRAVLEVVIDAGARHPNDIAHLEQMFRAALKMLDERAESRNPTAPPSDNVDDAAQGETDKRSAARRRR